MPQVFKYKGYLVYFWSNEYQANNLLEPVHFHIATKPSKNATKYWITSFGAIIAAGENTSKVPKGILSDIVRQVEINPELVINQWINHFGEIRYIDR